MMDVHPECRHAIVGETVLALSHAIPAARFIDRDGNIVRRLCANSGSLSLRLEGVFRTSGLKDEVDRAADAWAISDLPSEALPFLRASRYCETDLLSDLAWANFGAIPGGWAKVQAVCDFVHERLTFSYANARSTRTASEALVEGVGVCRDFTHVAVTLCRCLNIPARYCNGYLGDIGVLPDPAPMDFNAWLEAFLGGRWFGSTRDKSAADRSNSDRAGPGCCGHSDDHDIRFARSQALRGCQEELKEGAALAA